MRLVAALLFIFANTPPLTAQTFSTRDSAGVRIAMNTNTAMVRRLEPPRVGFTVGGLDFNGDFEFKGEFWRHYGRRLSNRSVVITDDTRMKVYTFDGHPLRVIGRKGNGLGEIATWISDVCVLRGDTLLVFEGNGTRVDVFTAAGKAVRTFRVVGRIWSGGCFADGSFVVRSPTPAAAHPTRAEYHLVSSTGKKLSSLGVLPMSDDWEGRLVNVVPGGDLVYVADAIVPEVRVLSRTGKLLRIVRIDDALVPFTEADFDRYVGSRTPRGVSLDSVRKFRDHLARLRPKTWPILSFVRVDQEQRLWISDNVLLPGHPGGYRVFDVSGRLIARVEPGKSNMETGRSFVGWLKDELAMFYVDQKGLTYVSFVPFKL